MPQDSNRTTGQPRRRRADRHGGKGQPQNPYQAPQPLVKRPVYQPDEEQAPLPLGMNNPTQGTGLPPRREAPSIYDDVRQPLGSAQYVEEYDDDDYPPLWPRLLALFLVLLLIISALLYFLVPADAGGVLGTLRGGVASVVDGAGSLIGLKKQEPPKLIKFETPLGEVPTGVKTVFTFAADSPIDGVRMMDDLGTEIKGQLSAADPEKTVWTLSTVFDSPVSGSLRAEIMRGETWFESDKVIVFSAYSPTPSPAPVTEVPMTTAPAETPLVVLPSQAPDTFVAPTPAAAVSTPFVVIGITPAPVVTQAPIGQILEPQTRGDAQAQPLEEPAESAGSGDAAVPAFIGEPQADVLPAAEEPAGILPMEEVPVPEEAPPVTAVPVPTATPMPMMPLTADEGTAPSKLKITDTVYQKGKRVNELAREVPVNMPAPGSYVSYEGGVFTFRNDSFRGNAAFGTADMPLQQLSVLWQAPLGSLRTADGTVYGLGWTSQPAIVKWSVELRDMMNLVAEKKDVKALKEVIVAAQDGKVYFFDLNDGVPTREPLDIGFPLRGSVSVDTQGRPLIGFGQAVSKMPGKTGQIGYYLYELIKQEELFFLNGRKTKTQVQYSTNGAFDGTALFDRSSDSLVLTGENGLLYTIDLGSSFDYLDKFELKVDPGITYLRTKGNQADMSVSSEASVAMYGKYAYTADRQGFIRAVDTDVMQTVWAFDAGDNTDATPALGFDEDGSLGLYTATTVFTRTRKAGTAFIRRLDAITGKEVWKYEVEAKYDQTERGGVKASPVVGERGISDLVIFTVNMTNDGAGATLVALDKKSGQEAWKYPLGVNSVSSPVAVYRPDGTAFLVQADESGTLSLLDARTGALLHALSLEGSIEASPAVYNDVLVIGTNDKDNNFLYGIRLE